MSTYEVTYKFTRVGYVDVNIEANSEEEAHEIARQRIKKTSEYVDMVCDLDHKCEWDTDCAIKVWPLEEHNVNEF